MDKSAVTNYIEEKMVAQEYVVKISEIGASIGVDIVNDRLNLVSLMDRPRQDLQEYMLTTLSWIEYTSRHKAVISAKLKTQKTALEKRRNTLIAEYMKEKNFARGSKGEAEIHAASNDEVQTLDNKLSKYEAYLQYLQDLIKQLEMLHYTCKEMTKDETKTAGKY